MKHKAKEYAKALVDVKKFNLKNFLRVLEKNGDRKKLKEIVALAERMMYRKIMIETARRVKVVWPKKKNDLIEEKINPDLIAGVKITVNGEKQLDFSLKNKVEKIFN